MTETINRQVGSFMFRVRALFSKPFSDELTGAVLVKERSITKNDLQEAMEYNIGDLLKKIRGSFVDDFPSPRIPIWLQLSITTMFVLAVSMVIFGYVIMERQKEKLYDNTIKLGMVSLNYFSNNAKIPLLNDDILELNTLINNAASVEGHFYAFIINNENVIKAHTDHEKIDKSFEPFENVDNITKKGPVTYFNYRMPEDGHVLNLSMPIMFNETKLGEVHVGLSIDFVRELFINERSFLAASILLIIVFGMAVAVMFSRRFSRPIRTLVRATAEIAKGNYEHKVQMRRKDELGTLGEAFNRMGDELYRQSIMRETFGKYVGSEVLDMIMQNPEKGWLKGRKSEASVLFADIRGFTAYAETKEPEEVVEKLNEFFEVATEIILKHGGYVDKFMGDSVLAVFGVPVSHAEHSKRCIEAALDMQREFAKAGRQDNVLLRSVGIGIASGVVVAGNIGSQVKTEYTVIGDCVNVASYLNSLARAGEIIVGNGMSEHFGCLVEVEALEPRKVKGKEELVKMFRVVDAAKQIGNDGGET
jgi:adenylate cyclase